MANCFWITLLSVNTFFIWIQMSHKGIALCKTDIAAALQPVNKVPIDEVTLYLWVSPLFNV